MTVRRPVKPAPLVAAASLVAVEAILLLGYAALELSSVSADRVAVAVTTSVFFGAYGALLLFCAREITRGRAWARSPIVPAQLIQLGVAWSFRGGDTTPVAIALAVVAVVVLAGLFAPASVDALAEDEDGPAG